MLGLLGWTLNGGAMPLCGVVGELTPDALSVNFA